MQAPPCDFSCVICIQRDAAFGFLCLAAICAAEAREMQQTQLEVMSRGVGSHHKWKARVKL